MRQHLEAVERMTHRPHERLHRRCPPPMAYLWGWFKELHSARQHGFSGPNAISHVEVDAWSRLRGISLTSEEALTIRALDNLYLEVRFSNGN